VYILFSIKPATLTGETKRNMTCSSKSTKSTTMKIVTMHMRVNPNELRAHIKRNLDRLFKESRHIDMHFSVEGSGNIIEIFQRENYEGFLFRIEVGGTDLHITRSEHYTDDVNSLTVESILNELFKDLTGKLGTDLVQEG
jgi:hypothetical protein